MYLCVRVCVYTYFFNHLMLTMILKMMHYPTLERTEGT